VELELVLKLELERELAFKLELDLSAPLIHEKQYIL
jgi:hypothetical protein